VWGMLRKVKIKYYNYLDKRSIKRNNKFYMERLVRKDEEYKVDTIKKLIDDIREYYTNIGSELLYYEKKKLKLQINNYTYVDLMDYVGIIMSIIIICVAVSSNILVTLDSIDKNEIIDLVVNFAIKGIVIVYIAFIINGVLNKKYDKNFDILCLDILEDIEKGEPKEIKGNQGTYNSAKITAKEKLHEYCERRHHKKNKICLNIKDFIPFK
jgi:hypothetical protein